MSQPKAKPGVIRTKQASVTHCPPSPAVAAAPVSSRRLCPLPPLYDRDDVKWLSGASAIERAGLQRSEVTTARDAQSRRRAREAPATSARQRRVGADWEPAAPTVIWSRQRRLAQIRVVLSAGREPDACRGPGALRPRTMALQRCPCHGQRAGQHGVRRRRDPSQK